MTLIVEIKNVFGKETVYPICKTSKSLCALTGNLTLTENAIRIIKNMGYTLTTQAKVL